jgi:hypothetical protein
LVLSGWLLCPVSRAADKDADAPLVMSESGQAVADLGLAYDLIEYGRKTKTPEALITAALILHRTPVEKSSEPSGGEASAIPAPAELLAEAKKLRPDDKALADVIAQAQDSLKEKPRGAVGGPKQQSRRLAPGAQIVMTANFHAKHQGVVNWVAGGHVKVEIWQQNRLLVIPPWVSAKGRLVFIPAAGAGPVTIKVTNVGKQLFACTVEHN